MTYQELVEKAREVFGKADVSGMGEHVAYQFNITGEAEGAFYLEVSNGEVHVEPYEYYDRDVLFTTTAETLLKIAAGKLDPVWAYTTGKLKLEGSIEKALLLKKLAGTVKETAEAPAEEKKEEPVAEAEAPVAEPVAETEEKKEEPAAEAETPAEEKKEESAAPAVEKTAPAVEKKVNAPTSKKRGRGKKRR